MMQSDKRSINHDLEKRGGIGMIGLYRLKLRRVLSLTLMIMLIINSIPFAGFTTAEEPLESHLADDGIEVYVDSVEEAVPEIDEVDLTD